MTEVTAAKPPKPTKIEAAEYQRAVWHVVAKGDCRPEDLTDPMYWQHVSKLLKPYSQIEALQEDGNWWARFLVTDTADKWARVRLLEKWNLREEKAAPRADAAAPEEYDIQLRGVHKQSIVRKSDGSVLKDGFQTKAEAQAFLASHVRSAA